MHDVLAHSLSALALQLEGTRLLARDRGADPEVVAGARARPPPRGERADRGAPGDRRAARRRAARPSGCRTSPTPSRARTLTVTGTPREPSSEARLALYRTAQEALTNVRRHSAADRVELRLDYADDGTTLDRPGPRAGRAGDVGGGGGYGLTGMRERAELLGGRLNAGPTDDGFRVELWLPAA